MYFIYFQYMECCQLAIYLIHIVDKNQKKVQFREAAVFASDTKINNFEIFLNRAKGTSGVKKKIQRT